MADLNHDVAFNVNVDSSKCSDDNEASVPLLQRLVAEAVGTYFLIFAGCGSIVVNLGNDKVVTQPGISIVWGLAVTVLVYSVGHISVTIAHASIKRFPLKEVPAYIVAQVVGAILASGTLRLVFRGKGDHFAGTVPAGSDVQAFVVEFLITFFLMFVVSGVSTDDRAIGELSGVAVGSTVLLNVMIAGPITGASMNPARSLGPAILHREYRGIWIYMVSPIVGALAATWLYNFISYTKMQAREITRTPSFLQGRLQAH
ncbi:hypothetical protein VNO80_28847 [Phaseolus coccineus]|uniref:Uncharacterized protein n=1 Tax=Phaseolus coccineus TaxID=3886 RepID=A0AAN9L9U5_PHACN